MKWSRILSSRTVSGKFPTQRCRVSRTILRWIPHGCDDFYCLFIPCKQLTLFIHLANFIVLNYAIFFSFFRFETFLILFLFSFLSCFYIFSFCVIGETWTENKFEVKISLPNAITIFFFFLISRNINWNKKYNQSSSDRKNGSLLLFIQTKAINTQFIYIRIECFWLTAARTFNFNTIWFFFFAFHTINWFTFNI